MFFGGSAKTVCVFFGRSACVFFGGSPKTVCVFFGGSSARNLGLIFDSKLSMKKHFIKICQTAYFELKRISSIRRFLTEDATKTLVASCILSRPDY